jgi:hypothetical protein
MKSKNEIKKIILPKAAANPIAIQIYLPKILIAIILLFFFAFPACIAQKQTGADGIKPIFEDYWNPWRQAIYISLALGVGIIAIAWMYASAVRDDKLIGWCKIELAQLAYSIIIIIAALALISSISSIVAAVSQISLADEAQARSWQAYVIVRCTPALDPLYDRPCHIRLAEDYLQILASATTEQARTVLSYNSILSVISSSGVSFRGIPDPSGYLDVAPGAGLSIPLETLGFLFDLQNKMLITLRFQQFLLEFLHLAFFPLFLSLGLFFRMLYFTRRIGGLLIAIALGAYIVYPMMFVFFHGILFSFTGPWPTPSPNELDAYTQKVGQALYPISLDMSGVQAPPQKPVPGGPGYNDPAPWGGVKGEFSANGRIEPWEECNEWSWAIRADTGKPNTQPFGCPPPSRPKDYYCNPNNAQCTSDPSKGYATYAGKSTGSGIYTTPFRQMFVSETISNGQRQALVNAASALETGLCSKAASPQLEVDEKELQKERELMLGISKAWYQTLLQGWGGAIMSALGADELVGFNGVIDNLAKIMIFTLIAPFISIMVMLDFIKVLSPLLGGDVEIAGLTKLI